MKAEISNPRLNYVHIRRLDNGYVISTSEEKSFTSVETFVPTVAKAIKVLQSFDLQIGGKKEDMLQLKQA